MPPYTFAYTRDGKIYDIPVTKFGIPARDTGPEAEQAAKSFIHENRTGDFEPIVIDLGPLLINTFIDKKNLLSRLLK